MVAKMGSQLWAQRVQVTVYLDGLLHGPTLQDRLVCCKKEQGELESAGSLGCWPKAGSLQGWQVGSWLLLRKGQVIGVLLRIVQ